MFQNCFRDYCCPLPVTHLTKERGRSEGANSALATTKNKRFVVLQEPESNEELKVGELKMLTGGDTVPVRDLYKKQEYIKPQFKMVLTCNALPGLSSTDRGVWRRLSVVEFISVFTDNPDPNEKYQFMIDENLGEKLAVDGPWVEPFIFMLIEYQYLKSGLSEPAEVRKYTDEYQSESDATLFSLSMKRLLSWMIVKHSLDLMRFIMNISSGLSRQRDKVSSALLVRN